MKRKNKMKYDDYKDMEEYYPTCALLCVIGVLVVIGAIVYEAFIGF